MSQPTSTTAQPERGAAPARARPWVWRAVALTLYAAIFAAFAAPWLAHLGSAIPQGKYGPDEELTVWILSWVNHALADPQARLFDANIYHPAPAQLTGAEYLLFHQVLFTPLYFLTRQPLLSTALSAFITYPLSALAFAALLVQLGCSRPVAWTCGLTFAVGMLRIPFNFQVLQYPNLFLPLALIAVVAARRAPGWRSALPVFAILLAAVLTSYYTAGIVYITVALWVAGALLAGGRARWSFAATVAVSAIAAAALATTVLYPYFQRSRTIVLPAMPWEHGGRIDAWFLAARAYWQVNCEPWRVAFAALALLCFVRGTSAATRRIALFGALLAIVSAALVVFGLPGWLGEIARYTPLRNFRGWVRLLVITDFGVCLLAAAGLDALQRRFGRRAGAIAIAVFALLTAVPSLRRLSADMLPAPAAFGAYADAYRAVKRHTDAQGRGPLLELPTGPTADTRAMLGSTFHWLPLLNGFTGYEPAHVPAVRAASADLPDAAALQDLVDLTHLRWILLRPDADWLIPRRAAALREGLRASPLIGESRSFDGFTLFAVQATPRRPQWYTAIAAGPQPGVTELGTPLRALAAADGVATVDASRAVVQAGGRRMVTLHLAVRNSGAADWPVLAGGLRLPFTEMLSNSLGREFRPHTVRLDMRWTPESASHPVLVDAVPLRRDVLAGETVDWSYSVRRPPAAGRYWLDVRVVQEQGPELTAPPGRMLHELVELQAPVAAARRRGAAAR